MEDKKKLMLGNAAIARGLYEAGVRFVSSYPGTPSTEITEYAAGYNEVYAEWAPNEKVALEAAIGASIGGVRSFSGMKHVGLNVAADPLFIASYTGVGAGLVIAVADDAGMHSSQNEQDSRHYAIASKIPMVEPSDSMECLEYVKLCYELSERYDTPFMVRLGTRVSHSQSVVRTSDRTDIPVKEYKKDVAKYVMMPANARGRHTVVEKRLLDIVEYSESCPLNTTEYNSEKIGIITSGISYTYAKEVFGEDASYLKLGMVNPLPVKLIKEFASKVERVIVIEELDDIIEAHCKKIGVNAEGKNLLPLTGEYSQEVLREAIFGEKREFMALDIDLPPRPPVLCSGCPHRGIFYLLKKMKLTVSGDIGCYTLGSLPPLSAMDTTLCMGASVSALHGFNFARGEDSHKKSIAVIGDSTFMHSGITGLINIVYNQGFSKVLILDNRITGMTGHQQNPCSGYTLKGRPAPMIDIEAVCRASGISSVTVIDPYDLEASEKALSEVIAADGPAVIIARRPCVLLKDVKKDSYFSISEDKCKGCKACMAIGCPCISFENKKAVIDTVQCTGCGVCVKLCKFDAIAGNKR